MTTEAVKQATAALWEAEVGGNEQAIQKALAALEQALGEAWATLYPDKVSTDDEDYDDE